MNNPNHLILLLLIAVFSSCSYDTYVENDECDTVDVSYANEILPMIDAYCISCHPTYLGSYENVSDSVTSSNIIVRIQLELDNDSLMPQGGPSLTDCQIDKFKSWVNQGAQNN